MSDEPESKRKKVSNAANASNASGPSSSSDPAPSTSPEPPAAAPSSSSDPAPSASPEPSAAAPDAENVPDAPNVPKPPNIPTYDHILRQFESPVLLKVPGYDPNDIMRWRRLDSKDVSDPCLPKGGVEKRTILRWRSNPQPCANKASRDLWEFEDAPGFFFPPLDGNGVFVPTKDRVDGRLYRSYVGKNGRPNCSEKVPTNRFSKHTVPKESKAKTAKNGFSEPQCSFCVVFGREVAKAARYPLLDVKNAVCGTCQAGVGAKRTLVFPCQGSCEPRKEANYSENVDGSGKKRFYCASCYKKKHGVPPPPQDHAKCDCDLKRVFNDCAFCCFASVPPRPVSKKTCINLVPAKGGGGGEGVGEGGGGGGGEGALVPCNTMMTGDHKKLCEDLFPDLAHPLCPSCMCAHAGCKAKRAKREDEWRSGSADTLERLMGDDFVPLSAEITFGSQAQAAACLVSTCGEDESRSRRVDFVLSLLSFSVVNELDQLGHDAYQCDHNMQWDLLVFQAMQELRGSEYDLYILRVNPDGKGEDGKRVSSAADRGVAVSARTSAEATVKAIAHGKARSEERAERRAKGEPPLPGKCFIAHFYYSADSVQLANEKNLCEESALGQFELLRL